MVDDAEVVVVTDELWLRKLVNRTVVKMFSVRT